MTILFSSPGSIHTDTLLLSLTSTHSSEPRNLYLAYSLTPTAEEREKVTCAYPAKRQTEISRDKNKANAFFAFIIPPNREKSPSLLEIIESFTTLTEKVSEQKK